MRTTPLMLVLLIAMGPAAAAGPRQQADKPAAVGEPKKLEYRATSFPAYADLDAKTKEIVKGIAGPSPETWWSTLCANQDDKAAALLANVVAFKRLRLTTYGFTGDEILRTVTVLAGDRIYITVDGALVMKIKADGHFAIDRADSPDDETGKMKLRGHSVWFGGSLHKHFDMQGYTGVSKVPRLQINYRLCDDLADVDIDGYPPYTGEHLDYENSDARQWRDLFVKKFGEPGFAVVKPGNPKVKVDKPTACPRLGLSVEETNALSSTLADGQRLGQQVSTALARGDGFELIVANYFFPDFAERGFISDEHEAIDEEKMPRDVTVSDAAAVKSFFIALADYSRTRALALEVIDRSSPDAHLLDYPDLKAGVVTATAKLRDRNALVKNTLRAASRQPAAAESVKADDVWTTVSTERSFGFPAGTTFVVIDIPHFQLLATRDKPGALRVVLATPREE